MPMHPEYTTLNDALWRLAYVDCWPAADLCCRAVTLALDLAGCLDAPL